MITIATNSEIDNATASVAGGSNDPKAISLTIQTANRAMNDARRAAARKALTDHGKSW